MGKFNSIFFLVGCIIVSVALIISVSIYTNTNSQENENKSIYASISGISDLGHALSEKDKETIAIGELTRMFGMTEVDDFKQEVIDGKLQQIPHIYYKGNLIFSKTAVNEWIIEQSRQRLHIK